MKKNPLLKFVLVRLALFVGILAAMLLLQFDPFFSAVVAAVLALSISLIFFGKQRDAASTAVYEWTKRKGDKDSAAEDASAEDVAEDATEGK
ncbi:MAG: hypothetical protein RL645_277 [Actinomycetota bacterium]